MHSRLFIKRSVFVFIIFLGLKAVGQVTAIGGIINIYTPVVAIDTLSCPNSVTVGNSSGISEGDKVLIIQMKGAKFDTTNTASFGSVLNLNGAGNYEIARVVKVTGNQIKLNGALMNYYDVSGKVQLVRVPSYMNANITSNLTCSAWNGQTGGVLVFDVQNGLQFNADIDVSGKGFRGGNISNNPDGSCGSGSPGYHYPISQPFIGAWAWGGAQKGEGICEIDTGRQAGRGPLVNGGGGGNKHNTGGGGGSNYTMGGKGGDELAGCLITQRGGLGGKDLSGHYLNGKLFAGGGGGCGDYNNFVGSDGENGGGIVIIIAPTIIGNNYKINANGNNVIVVGSSIADGAGGGGGGGAIFIKSTTLSGPLNVEANGGNGGDQNPTWGCVGPGGGGGTGILLTNMSSLAGVNYTLNPGAAGMFLNSAFSCFGTSYGAVAGSANLTGPIKNLNLNYTSDSLFSCGPNSVDELNSVSNISLVVYPNPANTEIFWRSSENRKNLSSVKIFDYSGRLISERNEKEQILNDDDKIDIKKLAAGMYFLELGYRKKCGRVRFVKTDN